MNKKFNDSNHVQQLPPILLNWLQRTQMAGLNIVAIATYNLPVVGNLDFINVLELNPSLNEELKKNTKILAELAQIFNEECEGDTNANLSDDSIQIKHIAEEASILVQEWHNQREALTAEQPIKLKRLGSFILVSCIVAQQDDHIASVSCLFTQPLVDNMLNILQLSLGWLFHGFIYEQFEQGERATKLLELAGDVLSYSDAKSAAQEWVNQTKQWTRQLGYPNLAISLFKVNKHIPKWWVSANVSWAVKGSPMMQKAHELASLAITECQPQQKRHWWVYPLHHRGKVSSVLVIKREDDSSEFSDELLLMLQANSNLFEPIFRQWRESEQNLAYHGYRSSASFLEKILGKGYLAYKVLSIASIIVLLFITLIPVDDVINAPLYIEGDRRYSVTTPQQGYIEQALVRAGDEVRKGQVIAKLETKDLQIEAAELTSQLKKSENQFRQAMASMDAAASGLAVNQKQQVQSQLNRIHSKLSRTKIVSPIDGLVVSGDWQQKVGTPVEEGTELFQIADVKSYRLILHVPDKDMDDLKVGQLGKMKLTSLPEQTFDFTITRLTAVAEVKNGENGFTIEASLDSLPNHIDGHDSQINPGMEGVGKIIVGKTSLISRWTKSLIDWMRLKIWSVW